MKPRNKLLPALLAALVAFVLALAFATPARAAEDYDDPDADNAILSDDGDGFTHVNLRDSDYEGGTIPRMDINFRDDIDPDTGEVILSGAEKIFLVNDSFDHTYKAEGVSVTITVPESYDNPEADMPDGVSGYTIEPDLELEFIRGRGNSTWRQEKKPYKLKFEDKQDLFGMGKSKHWALIANYFDQSLSIDRMIGYLGDQMGTLGFSPRGVPVDLYMNGTYYGSYVLMEEVRVEKTRLDINEVDGAVGDLNSIAITGDYLIGINRKPTAFNYEWFATSRGHSFTYDTPEYGPEPTATEKTQQQYLKQHLDRVEDAIYSRDLVSPSGESVWDLIDMETLADYWWIQEFTTNVDGFNTPSTYIYKLQDTVNADGSVTVGKLYWGPLWDFDFVWGQFIEEGFDNVDAEWVEHLRQDPEFVAYLKERWYVLDAKLEEITREGGLLDGYIAEMQASWDANRAIWPTDDKRWDCDTLEASINSLRSCIEARRAWINGHLDELQTAFHTLSFVDGETEMQSFVVREGEHPETYVAPLDDTDELLFDGWFTEDGKEFVQGDPVMEDAVYYAKWVDASEVTKGEEIYFLQEEIWTRPQVKDFLSEVLPLDARDKRIEWTSSDESVFYIDNGYLFAANDIVFDENGLAEAWLTGRLLGSGVEASVKVVLFNDSAEPLPEPTSITFDEKVQVGIGEDVPLRYVSEPTPNRLYNYVGFKFYIEDPDIATITMWTGVVTGVAPGTTYAYVYAYNQETDEDVCIATIEVVVGEAEPEPETFAITFDYGGGTIDGDAGPLVMQCELGEVITIPQAPVREGYTFLYWKGSEYYPGDEYTVEGEHTFTAEWEKEAEPTPEPEPEPQPQPQPQPEPQPQPQPAQPAKSETPRTGDTTAPATLFVLVACVVCSAAALVRKRVGAV